MDFSAEEKWEENIEAEDVPLHLTTVDVEGVEDMEAQAVPLHLFTVEGAEGSIAAEAVHLLREAGLEEMQRVILI